MIRHISVFSLKDGVDATEITRALDELCTLVAGPVAQAYGPDAGLRAGNGGFGVSFDFADEAAYRAWDTHPEHERIRRERIGPLLSGVLRCQFRV